MPMAATYICPCALPTDMLGVPLSGILISSIRWILSSFMFLWPCIVSKAWRKNTNKMQQYRWFIVNSRCWLLTTVSTCFGHLYAHHQEKRPRVTAYGVYLLVVLDVAFCGSVVLHCRAWALWRLQLEQQPSQCSHPQRSTTVPQNATSNTTSKIYSICSNTWSFLLMMGIKMPETCRDCSQ